MTVPEAAKKSQQSWTHNGSAPGSRTTAVELSVTCLGVLVRAAMVPRKSEGVHVVNAPMDVCPS